MEKTPFSTHATQTHSLDTTGFLNILLTWSLVFGIEISRGVPNQEVGDLRKFLFEALDRLHIHVGLGDQLRERDCTTSGLQ